MSVRFEAEALNRLAQPEGYPWKPVKLRHPLCDHPLFSLDKLADLAARMPADRLEYNRGDLALDQDPSATLANGLGPAQTVRTIETNGSWMVMKNVEADEEYGRLLRDCVTEIAAFTNGATGAPDRTEGFVFLSSPGSMTPFHMDPEHNVLCQLRGTKTMAVYPRDGLVAQEVHEAFHLGAHRNLRHEERFDGEAEIFELVPGDALHVPLLAPHWVRNGEAVSISFSITWRSDASVREGDLHRANAALRARGLSPRPPGGPLDAPKLAAYRALRRLGAVQ